MSNSVGEYFISALFVGLLAYMPLDILHYLAPCAIELVQNASNWHLSTEKTLSPWTDVKVD